MLDLNSCVKSEGGSIDLKATLEAVAAAVQAYNVVRENDLDKIGVAVEAVFAQYPSAHITKPALITLTLGKVDSYDPNAFGTLLKRIGEYVDACVAAGTLTMKKGKGGGYQKVA